MVCIACYGVRYRMSFLIYTRIYNVCITILFKIISDFL
jgi:hypothetical protein